MGVLKCVCVRLPESLSIRAPSSSSSSPWGLFAPHSNLVHHVRSINNTTDSLCSFFFYVTKCRYAAMANTRIMAIIFAIVDHQWHTVHILKKLCFLFRLMAVKEINNARHENILKSSNAAWLVIRLRHLHNTPAKSCSLLSVEWRRETRKLH